MNTKIQLILVEDEPAILRGLTASITQSSDDFEIVATAHNGVDALEKIKELKPHIVITDIQMPLMDGLDLIEAAEKWSPSTLFVILTGYAEFDYAKRAMQLRVADYLLKPVDPDLLANLLDRLKKEITGQLKMDMLSHLTTEFDGTATTSSYNPLKGYTVYLLFTFFGAVTSTKYNELASCNIATKTIQDTILDSMKTDERIQIFPLHHYYRNELTYALVISSQIKEQQDIVKETVTTLHQKHLSSNIFVSSILSLPIQDGLNISEHVRECHLYIASSVLFGQNQFMECPSAENMNSPLSVSTGAKEMLNELKPAMDPDSLSKMTAKLITFWKESSATQLQIQLDLRNILMKASQLSNFSNNPFSEPLELLAQSPSYEDLEENLTNDLNKLCSSHTKLSEKIPHTQALARKVRDYLDQNYTQNIIYKDFNDIFGYHEKYITTIFKDEYGMSPSKYILELRMTTAKNIMRENPDVLLKDVAESVGYDDPLYFSRVFKNNEGLSPKSYQKSLQKL